MQFKIFHLYWGKNPSLFYRKGRGKMKSVGHRTGYIEPKGFDFVIAVNTKYLFPAYPMP